MQKLTGFKFRNHLPLVVFVVTAVIGLFLPIAAYRYGADANRLRFEQLADSAVEGVLARVSQHVSLLTATRALFESRSGDVSHAEFSSFIRHLGLDHEFDGIQGIGYARVLRQGGEAGAERIIADNYGITRNIFPDSSEATRTAITMLEPADERNRAAMGFDMFTEKERRAAMIASAQFDRPRATGRVTLLQEIDGREQPGFLVYLPFFSGNAESAIPAAAPGLKGFIYGAFRVSDLVDAAVAPLDQRRVTFEIYDGQMQPENLLFRSDTPNGGYGDGYVVQREVAVAGRYWRFVLQPTGLFREGPEKAIALLLGAVLLLLAAALAMSLRSQQKALEASREVGRVNRRASIEKDMLLQEMKHRIKNSIARIMAIARQTANKSTTLEEFTQSFDARLQAMAASQDLLTRSAGGTASLQELLGSELVQVFGDGFEQYSLEGPGIELGARPTQSLGLVFHELATNALKYGQLDTPGNRLDISWHIDGSTLRLDWIERTGTNSQSENDSGFGSRLITSIVERELGGNMDRELTESGLKVRMEIAIAQLA